MQGAVDVMNKSYEFARCLRSSLPAGNTKEGVCTLTKAKDFDAVAIGKLERYVADWKYAQPQE